MKKLFSTFLILLSVIISFLPSSYAKASYEKKPNWLLFQSKGSKKEYINTNHILYDNFTDTTGIHIKYTDSKNNINQEGVLLLNCTTRNVTFTPIIKKVLLNNRSETFKMKRKDFHYQVFCK